MYDKFKKKMFKTRKREDIYIIEKIVKNFNEFILSLLMYYDFASLININIIHFNMYNFETETVEIVTFVFINLINVNTNLMNVINDLNFVNLINYN